MAFSMLSIHEKVRIRHHLGYMNMSSAYTFIAGAPTAVQTNYLIEGAMDRVLEESLGLVRELVSKLDAIEAQQFGNLENMAVRRIGDIEINEKEQEQLMAAYAVMCGKLANLFGITVNPYSKIGPGAGAINGKVYSC